MTLNDTKIIAEIIALFAAGGWAILSFSILYQRRKAIVELKNLEFKLKNQIAVINPEISVNSILSQALNVHYLMGDVKLKNTGKCITQVKWEGQQPAFTVWQVVYNNLGVPTFQNSISQDVFLTVDPNNPAISHIIRPGGSEQLSFCFLIQTPGLYLLTFRGELTLLDANVAASAGANPQHTVAWTASRYIVIQ